MDDFYDLFPLNYWHTQPLSPGMSNQVKSILAGVPILGDIQRSIDNYNYYNDYMRNRGLSWADVRYPSRISTLSFGGTLNFVSKNIDKLYERLFFYQTFYSFFFPRGSTGEFLPRTTM